MGGWGGDDEPPDPRRVLAAANLDRLHARIDRDVAAGLGDQGVTTTLICDYHAIAMAGILEPGAIRTRDFVVGSRFGSVVFHEPPPAPDVPSLLDAACAEINAALATDFVRAAAYA